MQGFLKRRDCYWMGIVLGITAMAYWFNHSQVTVVTFDKNEVVKQFVTQLSQQKIEEKKTQQLSSRFARILKEALNDYARTHQVIVIKKEMTLASSADITDKIATQIADNMKGSR
ncbi:TrbI F-type domain-containing protein [Legionella drozanskii]|uniref:F pilus extension/retraction protein TrbI Inner membrane protein n=1 Tax=Legionella drozanskii LLAP-1 TaxID=1212489 RepID=A0A0W0SMJ0_9GAMM|nr:TrbI F-type domain-containing protein [Legionella drozanskii]KTC84397.1 F pilus extension/retraction protein TrbI Inner membrane protein [Legionella drozanskii LLAP-1]